MDNEGKDKDWMSYKHAKVSYLTFLDTSLPAFGREAL
jgi:hypothetical protein